MKEYLEHNEWKIIENGFFPEYNRITESVCSLGNGRMGQRANFEEKYSGDTLQGSYVAGVYYPDKTRVGWWKNGYPEYFAKVLNAPNWIGINVFIDGEELDLAKVKVEEFRRELDMKVGTLYRTFIAELSSGKRLQVESTRFTSITTPEAGAIRYSVTPLNFTGTITLTPHLDGDVVNQDSNYDEKFWNAVAREAGNGTGYIITETRKTLFRVCTGMNLQLFLNKRRMDMEVKTDVQNQYVSNTFSVEVSEGETLSLEKYAVVLSSGYHPKSELLNHAKEVMHRITGKGFDVLLKEQADAWAVKWETSDITIQGDVAAQQGIRFNIFQLNQTYTGDDPRLNIGPKGFTGEKYGGSTYWDTEAYCFPFYLATAPEEVARNLLLYRHKHLQKAIENAEKLGFTNGAALYPMVTMNGEECHNEWEITFEEIHRNGAIAYAIYDYIRYAGNKDYLAPYGFEVLLGISRFWAQRINWSNEKEQYVMLGVTGPNEYENNVNNNFHTNRIATWTLEFTLEAIDYLKENHRQLYEELKQKWNFNEDKERLHWKEIILNMYYPYDEDREIFLQQDGFLDKELIPVAELDKRNLPLNQKWSWDRILRSCYIKQADTLQSMYLFEDDYDAETLKRHFDFYEPITVHESSLSPCVHSILAARIGNEKKAYEMYLRTARLDLDDYNNDTEDGCHTTSMAGTWMAFVQGFGGMRVHNHKLCFHPFLPKQWESYSFRINFRGDHIQVKTEREKITFINHSGRSTTLVVFGEEYQLPASGNVVIEFKKVKIQ